MAFDRRQVIGAGLTLATWPGVVHAAGEPLLDPATMQRDVAVLGDAYRALHPGLLRYQTAAEFDARLAALNTTCARPLPLGQFYLRLSRLLADVRCGHSYANFFNQTAAVQAALFTRRDRLPFTFRWIGDAMVVTGDPAGTGIIPGSVIETIDGRRSADILAALLPLIRADGHNDAKRRALLSAGGAEQWETFDIFYSLVFNGGEQIRLRVRAPNGTRRTLTVAAIGLDQRRAQRPPNGDPKGDAPLWTMTRIGRVAVLTMPTWSVYDSKWNWRAWLDARLDEIAVPGTDGLVVDLRANEGGLDCGDAVVARLIDRPVAPLAARRLVRYRQVPAALRPALQTYDDSFFDWGDRATRRDDRFFDLAEEGSADRAIVPGGQRFYGKVVVVVGPQNSSATFNFADLIQRERLGRLIGEPTGGNRRGINGGAFFFVTLPGSTIEVDLPLIGSFPEGDALDAGLLPDVAVPPTAAAIAAGRDDAMSEAVALAALLA